jgi:glycosyltransferase involved in cell wall biosynthesis
MSAKQKLYYVLDSRFPTEKAYGYQSARMVCEYERLGFDGLVLAPSTENKITQKPNVFYGFDHDIKVKYIKVFPNKFNSKLAFFCRQIVFVVKLFFLKFSQGSVVVTRSPFVAFVLSTKKVKVFYECHDWFVKNSGFYVWLVRNVHKIVVTNSFIKERFVKNGFVSERVLVAPNGVDEDIFNIKLDKDVARNELVLKNIVNPDLWEKGKYFLLYTGSLKTKGVEKGVGPILNAMSYLDDSFHFIAVGGNLEDVDFYKNESKKIGVSQKVTFLNRVDQSTMALFQCACDIMLMPFPRLAHYEYFMSPLKMFEYMCSERPIIASDLPSIKEILNEDSAFFVKSDDVKDLFKTILYVINNPQAALQKSQNAMMEIKKYTWSKRAEGIVQDII